MDELTDEKILEVHKALMEADVPQDNRYMYYYQISWWRHPIKRWKQKRYLRYILQTTEEAVSTPPKKEK